MAEEVKSVPIWHYIIGGIGLPLVGYIFGAGGSIKQLETLTTDVAQIKNTVDSIQSHSEARDEQYKFLNKRIDDMQDAMREMRERWRQQ